MLKFYKNNDSILNAQSKSGERMGLTLSLIEKTNDVDGSLLELGVFQGGTTVVFAKFLQQLKSDKQIFACDTFSGYPYKDNNPDMPLASGQFYADTNIDRVKNQYDKFNVSDQITIIEGRFDDTLHAHLSDQRFSFAYFDADLYNSTKVGFI